MSGKKRFFFYCLCGILALAPSGRQASAARQRYRPTYVSQKAVYQKNERPYYHENNLPFAGAYIEVSRKRPKVSVEYQPEQTVFAVGGENVPCRGKEALSCTSFGADFSVNTDCDTSRLTLKVVEKPKMTIRLSSLYPKGSCPFDLILKHELKHAEIYRNTLKSFIDDASERLEAEYVAGQKSSAACNDIIQNVLALTAGFAAEYEEKAQAENAATDDGEGAHKYGFEACSPRRGNAVGNEMRKRLK